jgi:uncharacterized protein (DUF305 family)
MDARTEPRADLSLDQWVELERRAAERAERTKRTDGDGGGDDVPGDGDGDDDGDGDIVLAWWQHPINVVTLVVSAALIAAMLGWMVGDNRRPAHNNVDTGFLQDMRLHHEQAVVMSLIYRNRPDIDPGLDIVARTILVGQNIEVGRMIQLLRMFGEQEAASLAEPAMVWMGMPSEPEQMLGMATEDDLATLGRVDGAEADRLFVELMVAHHEGGVHMAEYAVENGEHPEVVAFARSIVDSQQGEIVELRNELD